MLEAYPNSPEIAREYFESKRRGKSGSGHNTMAYIRNWTATLYVHGSVFDRPRSGRPSLLSDDDALLLSQLLVAGHYKSINKVKVWRGFSGLRDACSNRKYGKPIRKVLEKYDPDIDLESAMRRIKAVVPWLGNLKRNVDFKMQLSPEVKNERKTLAELMRGLSIAELEAVIWLDAKKYYVEPGSYKVYCMDPDMVVEDPRIPKGSSKGTVLHYYAAVNAKLGVVYFCWVTGTTGLATVYTTRVRLATLCSCGVAFVVCMLHRLTHST